MARQTQIQTVRGQNGRAVIISRDCVSGEFILDMHTGGKRADRRILDTSFDEALEIAMNWAGPEFVTPAASIPDEQAQPLPAKPAKTAKPAPINPDQTTLF